MIFLFLWRAGLVRRMNAEKIRFFLGATGNSLYLSRREPLVSAISWPRALVSPRYARAVVGWLAYRADLFDGLSG